MVKAMYAGVAGLKAHQSKMDVISNNIANVNTWGYKSMDTSFKESIYQTVSGATSGSKANGGLGGTNPAMVGYGAMVSTISSNFTKGTQVPTGQPLDMFIDGTGFFVVGPMYDNGASQSPDSLSLTRVGDFKLINGYLVDGNGRYVYGCSMETGGEVYEPKAVTTSKEELVKIPIGGLPQGTTKPGANGSTTTIKYEANIPNDGYMKVTTTLTEIDTAAGFIPNANPPLIPPTSDEDLASMVRVLNEIVPAAGQPEVRFVLSEDSKQVTVTSTYPKAAPNTVLTAGNLRDPSITPWPPTTVADVKQAVDYANRQVPPDRPEGTTYKADGTDIIKIEAVTSSSRGNSDAGTPAGVIGVNGGPSATDGSTIVAIEAAIAQAHLDAVANGEDIKYTFDKADKNKITKTTITKDFSKEIPLVGPKTETLADGTIITTSYQDNKIKDGLATKVVTTTVPVSSNDVFKGPSFDDGRMVMDAEGTYTMTTGVSTLKPIKLPTTFTYYDENGLAHTDTNPALESFSIRSDGMLYATSKTTNESYLLGAVALANVTNPGGMMKGDGPYYTTTGSSGSPTISTASGATGELRGEFLESANVEIATEFSSMITTQRGFQANSKIITVSDEMLQELVNMKR